ncbi:hypothetical protein GCM10018962_14040 [Dactylosporangium matsuzakiense]|uniref:Uncharacterized protein n=1 Tax=Dactylosporangium matsuzakiense TaxID=53360 RepID=A0A9W6NQW6_9ACTN|nr:hypothetical protein GCM10017581_077170 [Dactylosporangium matsuzakiense]
MAFGRIYPTIYRCNQGELPAGVLTNGLRYVALRHARNLAYTGSATATQRVAPTSPPSGHHPSGARQPQSHPPHTLQPPQGNCDDRSGKCPEAMAG